MDRRRLRRGILPLVIPCATLVMYLLAAIHWFYQIVYTRASLLSFRENDGSGIYAGQAATANIHLMIPTFTIGLSVGDLLARSGVRRYSFVLHQTTMSEMIVLWRMCIIWDKKRPLLLLSIASALIMFG